MGAKSWKQKESKKVGVFPTSCEIMLKCFGEEKKRHNTSVRDPPLSPCTMTSENDGKLVPEQCGSNI
ncbi:hypothetical protein Y032_0084g1789 [Ancylostoma ceylanicum]|uniref:Uncharacterized protein n=1 Tax=Ancylostoma ceylanicum TaxID=53326 RepID=A0A016TQ38_9BILA|nr:hypothetical protein Y032_0084g1789 [Ancylostoma ceylanicum]